MAREPARAELFEALREYRDGEVGRERLMRACGALWNSTNKAPLGMVAAVADVVQELPRRRTYGMLVRAIRRQLKAELSEGKEFKPYGRRRVLSRGDCPSLVAIRRHA